MAIREFNIAYVRNLRSARANDLGNLIAIAGPNGAGKSSILDTLRSRKNEFAEPGTDVLYIGAHRNWRAMTVHKSTALNYPVRSFGKLLESDEIPRFNAWGQNDVNNLLGQSRGLRGDDAQTFVKLTLIKLNDIQNQRIADAWGEQGGEVAPGTVQDVFAPFADLVKALLPHLQWVGVRPLSDENVLCLFKSVDGEAEFDIDELSSGEKSALALFLPFVEPATESLNGFAVPGFVDRTVLIDEPELHLHPILQLRVLQYMRELASSGKAQFIIATHSPTILDALADDELYLLSPASIAPDNQLSRLSGTWEYLEAARSIAGGTHLLTRAKPIVLVEGDAESPRNPGDARLIGLLAPRIAQWALVSSGGRSEVRRTVDRLRSSAAGLPGTPIFGLVDRDQSTDGLPDYVVGWPVAMIENLLLDPEAIQSVLAPHYPAESPPSVADIERVFRAAVEAQFEDEVRLRSESAVSPQVIRFEASETFPSRARESLEAWLTESAALSQELAVAARASVQLIVDQGRTTEAFRGKPLFRRVYDELGVRTGLSLSAFTRSVALAASERTRAKELMAPAIQKIQLYFPDGIPSAIQAGIEEPTDAARELSERAQDHRDKWEADDPEGVGREALRRALYDLAVTFENGPRGTLTELASQIGTIDA